MMNIKYVVTLLLLPGLYWAQNVGDKCILANKNEIGTCIALDKCPSALASVHIGERPTICSFVGITPIICCESSASTTGKAERMSSKKCHDYMQVITTKKWVSTLSIDAPPKLVSTVECTNTVSLIVGGQKTEKGEFPHMASLGWRQSDATIRWNCGASIISERWLLSAGHCRAFEGNPPDIVRTGVQQLHSQEHIDYKIDKTVTPPDYSISSYYNDLLLIRVADTIIFNKYLRPACLWNHHSFPTTVATATGWGQTDNDGGQSSDLLKVSLNLYSNTVCSSRYPIERKLRLGIVKSQLCAGALEGGKDTCQGDSGGPLQIVMEDNQCVYYIVGVTSFGKACGVKNGTGVYTRVSSFLSWIESVVWN